MPGTDSGNSRSVITKAGIFPWKINGAISRVRTRQGLKIVAINGSGEPRTETRNTIYPELFPTL